MDGGPARPRPPGPGVTWWIIDELKFDQYFLSVLSIIASALTLAGMFIFRRFMAERSIASKFRSA